jgi:membrane protease YdiL (CAAX protease family)
MRLMAEIALAFYLVFILPGMQLRRSLRPVEGPKRSRTQRYLSTIRQIALLLLALAAVCWWNGYTPAALGLSAPTAGPALWSLTGVAIALPVLHFVGKMFENKMDPAKRAAAQGKILANQGFPRTPAELRLFILLMLFVAVGWELLYRGFLMLALTPLIGTWGAVAVAAVAYGAGHGYQGAKPFAGAIVSALLFTVGYVLTDSLWWLMLVHFAMPMAIPIGYYKLMREPAPPPEMQLD